MSYQYPTATSSTNDITHLECFLESLLSSSLPNEIKRALDHLRDLDHASGVSVGRWREEQDGLLGEVEGVLGRVFDNDDDGDGGVVGGDSSGRSGGNQLGTKRKREEDVNDTAHADPTAKRAKVATQSNLDAVGEGANAPISHTPSPSKKPKRQIPTNYEISTVLQTNIPHYTHRQQSITQQYQQLQQIAQERIHTAIQLKSMVEMALGRLNRDLRLFERELGVEEVVVPSTASVVNGRVVGGIGGGRGRIGCAFSSSSVGVPKRSSVALASASVATVGTAVPKATKANTTTSATVAATPTRHATILATASRQSSSSASSSVVPNVPPPPTTSSGYSSAASSNASLSTATPSALHPPITAQPSKKDLAAMQLFPNTHDWILVKIISYDKYTKIYTLSDEDTESDKIYKIPAVQVVPLNGAERNRYNRGDAVYAVYPDTTVFYHATVGSTTKTGFVLVTFQDDGDENGITHEKAVPLGLVMKVPV
ncbi:predicted protein [Thalassiosira pseudonana CCMP1335]|uniref:SGF29 C-terminal domain-containing protein n=1 Tax=Thalassiosira pseudonana TaxID=35128 RepID=B8CA92_THAPS|nr:predicted protein [Thalassiosira pseudonana CCMP1335]EED89466.1 predicted protein [Thalassiosira pseudonana CCMP1335]